MSLQRRERVGLLYYRETYPNPPFIRWREIATGKYTPSQRQIWVKVTVYYEGTTHGSYHVDCGKVAPATEDDAEVIKELLTVDVKSRIMAELKWSSWNEIEMNLGLRVGVAVEEEGEEEEWCEVWRI